MKKTISFAAFIGKLLAPFMVPAQELTDWKVDAPPNSVQLVSVEPVGDVENNFLKFKFNFKNVSGKTIVELRVFKPDTTGTPGTGAESRRDSFPQDAGAVLPGATFFESFSKRDSKGAFSEARALQIDAIVYSDGTRAGSKRALGDLEDMMIGEALEIKRDTDILAASPDPSVAGFDTVAKKIAQPLPSAQTDASSQEASASLRRVILDGIPQTYTLASAKELSDSLRGIAVADIPQSYLDSHLDHPSSGFYAGVLFARQVVLGRMKDMKSNSAVTADLPEGTRKFRKKLQSHALTDLARTLTAVCEKQTRFYRAYLGTHEATQ